MAAERAVERRIVSVLFADLVGFTSLSERLDAEDVATVQAAYFATVRETIGRYGGRLEKFIGDAAMAVFGVPRARDDDGERAVRAGLALAAAVEQLGARIGLDAGALGVRVGVNTGEVVHTPDAGPEEAMVTGEAVNVAARLQAAAGRGEVLVGETTALAVEGAVELGKPQALELKGKADPVPARRAVGVRPEPSREAAMGALRAPLLGRADELRVLRDELERARAGSRRLLVVAPPGVGKTRLVDELADRAEAVAIRRARLRPDALAPFDAVAQLLASAGAEQDGLEDRLRAAGVAPARAAVLVEEALVVLRPADDQSFETDRESRFAAWIELLDALAGGRAGLWLVEDVHWAGFDLLAFLAFAGQSDGRRLVAATARPALLGTAADWCAGFPQLDLRSLPPADASELVRALVGEALPAELVAEIAARSDGNPLFIEELLRMWISLGELLPDGVGWRLRREAREVSLPHTVQGDLRGPTRRSPRGRAGRRAARLRCRPPVPRRLAGGARDRRPRDRRRPADPACARQRAGPRRPLRIQLRLPPRAAERRRLRQPRPRRAGAAARAPRPLARRCGRQPPRAGGRADRPALRTGAGEHAGTGGPGRRRPRA